MLLVGSTIGMCIAPIMDIKTIKRERTVRLELHIKDVEAINNKYKQINK